MLFRSDDKNRLWVATAYGLALKSVEDSLFTNFIPDFYTPSGLKGNDVITLLQDFAGTIWAGTNQGLFFYVEAENTFSKHESISTNFITSIEADHNNDLWIGTHEGLLKLNPITGDVCFFGEYDGLQGLDFNPRASFFNGVDNLYFAGPGGVNLFYPDNLVFNDVPPTIRFSKFLLFNRPIEEYQDGKLPKKEINSIDEIVLEIGRAHV